MNLPFTKFRLQEETFKATCRIIKTLDEVVIDGISQSLLLIRVDSPNISSSEYWIGGFVYEEGIGGRATLDAQGMRWFKHVHWGMWMSKRIKDGVAQSKKRIAMNDDIPVSRIHPLRSA